MLPLRIIGKDDFRAYMTFALLFLYVSFFFWEVFLTASGGQPISEYLPFYALATCELGDITVREVAVDSVRAIFMSTGFIEVFINIMFLWAFGPAVEKFLGRERFLTLFIFAGLFGYLFTLQLSNFTNCEVIYGPNSAIAGLVAAFIFLHPTRKIETRFPAIDRRFELPGILFAFSYLAIQLIASGEGALSGDLSPVWDEIGGFIFGLVFIFIVTMFKPAPKADPFEYLDN